MAALYFRVSSDLQTTENQFEDLIQVAEKFGSGGAWGPIRQALANCVVERPKPNVLEARWVCRACPAARRDGVRPLGPNQWAIHLPLDKLKTERRVPVDSRDRRPVYKVTGNLTIPDSERCQMQVVAGDGYPQHSTLLWIPFSKVFLDPRLDLRLVPPNGLRRRSAMSGDSSNNEVHGQLERVLAWLHGSL